MKVALMVPEMDLGGVEEGTFDLASGFLDRGIETVVIAGGGRYDPLMEKRGIRRIDLPTVSKTPAVFLRSLRALKDILAAERPDILHCRSRFPAWIGAAAVAAEPRTRFVTSIHGFYGAAWYSRVLARGERVICVSDALAAYARARLGADPARVRVVYNGVKTDPFVSLDKEPARSFTVGAIGRLTRVKGYRYLIEGAAAAARGIPDLAVLIVGEGPCRSELERTAARLGLRNVRFVSGRSAAYLPSMDVLGAPHVDTEWEAPGATVWQGRVAAEAQLAGTPVVTTLRGVPAGTFVESETALFVPPRDAAAIARAIARVRTGGSAIERMVAAARRTVLERFSVDGMVERTLAVYRELLEGRP